MHPKRLHKIKLGDVLVILTLFLFLVEVINMYCIGFDINSLNFQHCNNLSVWRLWAKEFSFTVTFIVNTFIIKANQKTCKIQVKQKSSCYDKCIYFTATFRVQLHPFSRRSIFSVNQQKSTSLSAYYKTRNTRIRNYGTRNISGTPEHWWSTGILAEKSEYHGIVEHEMCSGITNNKTRPRNNTDTEQRHIEQIIYW